MPDGLRAASESLPAQLHLDGQFLALADHLPSSLPVYSVNGCSCCVSAKKSGSIKSATALACHQSAKCFLISAMQSYS